MFYLYGYDTYGGGGRGSKKGRTSPTNLEYYVS